MEPSCVRHNLIPGTSRLFGDYLYHFDALSSFFPYSSWNNDSVVESARTLTFPAERRKQIVEALAAQNSDSGALNKLADPRTVAVVTGQQVGFLLGPEYTIFKALTAVRIASHLNEKGIPAVPIFWLATEDHDLAEVDHAWVFNQVGTPAKISIANTVVNGGPVGQVTLNEIPLAELRNGLGDLPFAKEVMDLVAGSYQTGTTLGTAFRKLLEPVLKDMGLLYLDPLAEPVRRIGAQFLAEAAPRIPELLPAILNRNSALIKAGYHTQVHIENDSSLLFLLDGGRRLPLRFKDGQFVSKDGAYSTKQLAENAARLSPNALLRPVMQDYLLPTAAYVGGPAEIAYFAQASTLYEKLLGRMPVIYPRNGFTLLDSRAEKLISRFHLTLPDLLDHQEKVKALIAARLVPNDLANHLQVAQSALTGTLAKLQVELRTFDATLASAAQKSAAKIAYQMEKLARKTARETLLRDERASNDAAYLVNLIYPNRHLQERFYSILPFLAKHGLDLPKRLLAETQLNCPDHMVRTF